MGWFITQSLAFIVVAALVGLAIGIWIGWLVWGHRAKGKHTAEKEAARGTGRTGGASAEDSSADGTAADEAAPVQALAVAAGTAAGTTAAAAAEPSDDDRTSTRTDAAAQDAPAEEAPAASTTGDPAGDEAARDGSAEGSTGDAAGTADGDTTDGAHAADAGTVTDSGTADVPADDTAGDTAEAEVTAAESDVVAEAEAVARAAAEANAAAQATDLAASAGAEETVASDTTEAPVEAAAEAEPQDDLQRIEGIGPKIAAALAAAGYGSYARIAGATEDELRQAVASQGIKFAPSASTWADQAQYLVDHDADGLQEYQDYLIGGQERRAKFNENVDYADVDEIEGAEAKAAALAADEAEAAAAEAAEPEPEPEPQDLQRIEGIGPKIEAALKAAGYTTYAKIAAASEADLRDALATAGITFAPAATSWADQAQYLVDGDEDGLQEYQDYLVGGQERRAKFVEDVDYADVDEIEGAEAKAAALAADEAKVADAEGDTEPQAGVKA
ncbi:helix-hairpin-helix domain-containing protein [Promicromonospora thailandica]|uniref:Helix-hairpin-helix domain-containing protein n=1 Tax=Promicromonospora thailandica TaxID=765201 RepID=A0A9X2JXI0_9MICO|nr:helix-hairpin-helix domain-containing protein [Promicromonospora thailandica]MCP2264184.1 Helix-hairpin-helix domain-containing protein [Promicromonospora thailandica]BFF21149.1 hypothetical protein GCM10025730_46700 [Promicromonospora thailandica]